MKRQTRTTFASLAFAAVLLAGAPAHADEGLVIRVATGVGQLIASQGNAALLTIRDEIASELPDQVKPFLPAQPESSSPSTDEHDTLAAL